MVAVLACVAEIVVDVVYNAVQILLPTEIFLLSIYLSGSLDGKSVPARHA